MEQKSVNGDYRCRFAGFTSTNTQRPVPKLADYCASEDTEVRLAVQFLRSS
jgi:hypothetical protein